MIDKNKQYTTRSGLPVEIYATDRGGDYPVHGAVLKDGFWSVQGWTAIGEFNLHVEQADFDLVEVKPRIQRTEWFNIYRDRIGGGHKTREGADYYAGKHRIACIQIPIDCEEGEGL